MTKGIYVRVTNLMLKKITSAFLALLFFFFLIKPVFAQTKNKVNIHFFWSKGCPHCRREMVFLESLKEKYPQIEIKDYETSSSREAARLLLAVGKELSANVSYIPFTVIGRNYVVGFYNDETTGKEIEEKVKCALKNGCEDLVRSFTGQEPSKSEMQKGRVIPESLKVPIFGKIEIKNLSLPVLTFIIAFLDGFNPCAMWVLLFLISLLLGMKNRVKMYILGSVFIISSGFVYFLFLSAWLNLFLFLGFVLWVRIVIGIVALSAGGYNLHDYFTNREGVCKVTGSEKRQKVFEKLKEITQKKQFILALAGIILLAFAVNLIELVCSAGLPAIYTQVLSLAKLPNWQYYLYLLFYIIIFMLDDLVIFIIAMTTLHAVGIDSKYSRFSHLAGGIIMVIIGILMLFKPEFLMFG